MPTPKKNESKQKYLNRCTRELIENEGKKADEAYAQCNSMWDKANNTAKFALQSLIKLAAGDGGKARSFLITAYTGQPIKRMWGPDIILDIEGMSAKESIPILREHQRDRIVGYSSKAWADDNKFYLSGDVTESTQDGKEIVALADEGFPWQASVGVWARNIESLEDENVKAKVNGMEVKGPMNIWRQSMVGETSFVALGADDRTAAIVLSNDGNFYIDSTDYMTDSLIIEEPEDEDGQDINVNLNLEVCNMDKEQFKKEYSELYDEIMEEARQEGREAGFAEGVETERIRVMELMGSDADPDAVKKAIEDGASLEASFKMFFEAEKKKRADALASLEEDAQGSLGQKELEETTPADQRPADVQLDEKAREIMKEKDIKYPEALKMARRENPDLVKAWETQAIERQK